MNHDLGTRPDLQPLFGALSPPENDALLDRLLAIDSRLTKLASDATNHVGVPYHHTGLQLFVRSQDAEISGGPTGSAGDIWFEVSFTLDNFTRRLMAPPWTVDASIVVFCIDRPEGRGESNTHSLVYLLDTAHSPMGTLDLLESLVNTIEQEIYKRDAAIFTRTPHAQLP